MERFPRLVDNRPSPLVRAATYLLIPIVLVVALPIILLLILLLYLAAIFQGARVFVFVHQNKNEEPDNDYAKPHFLDIHPDVKSLPDESQTPST